MEKEFIDQLAASFGSEGLIYKINSENPLPLPVEGYYNQIDGIHYACVQQEVDLPDWEIIHISN